MSVTSHFRRKSNVSVRLVSLPTEKEQEPKLTCEYCGWVDFAYTFKGSKRFCSMVCAKRQVTFWADVSSFFKKTAVWIKQSSNSECFTDRYNVGCTKRIGLFRPERSKPTNRWRRRSQGLSSIEAKKQVHTHSYTETLTHTLTVVKLLHQHFTSHHILLPLHILCPALFTPHAF